jgi:hypothetical protein
MERLKGGAGSADEREMSKRSGHRLVAVPGYAQMEFWPPSRIGAARWGIRET